MGRKIDMANMYAFSFADRTTWVGRFDEQKRTLEGVIIFETPTTETFDKTYVGMDEYMANMYKSKILEREGHQIKENLPTAKDFDSSKAIAKWNLE